jgi:hypothetical protein
MACGSAVAISGESFGAGGAADADSPAARTSRRTFFISTIHPFYVLITPLAPGEGEIVDKKLIGGIAVQP